MKSTLACKTAEKSLFRVGQIVRYDYHSSSQKVISKYLDFDNCVRYNLFSVETNTTLRDVRQKDISLFKGV